MPLYGFKDKSTAETLKAIAQNILSSPKRSRVPLGVAYDTWEGPGVSYPGRKLPSLRGYVVAPLETIPAARRLRVGGKFVVRVGEGNAYLYKRTKGSQDLEQQTDDAGSPVTVTIYNTCPAAIEPSELPQSSGDEIGTIVCFVTQDMWGDLYVVEKCEFPDSPSLSSSSGSGSGSGASSSSGSGGSSSGSPSSGSDGSDGSDSGGSDGSGGSDSGGSGGSTSQASGSGVSVGSAISCADFFTGTKTVYTDLDCSIPGQICFTCEEWTFVDGKLCSIEVIGLTCCETGTADGVLNVSSVQRSNGVSPPNGPSQSDPAHGGTYDLGIATVNETYILTVENASQNSSLDVTVSVSGTLFTSVSPSVLTSIAAGGSQEFTLTVVGTSSGSSKSSTVSIDHTDGDETNDPYEFDVETSEIESE